MRELEKLPGLRVKELVPMEFGRSLPAKTFTMPANNKPKAATLPNSQAV